MPARRDGGDEVSPLFLDHSQSTGILEHVEKARLAVRKAKRYTTKAESRHGKDAHQSLHDAEKLLDTILTMLR